MNNYQNIIPLLSYLESEEVARAMAEAIAASTATPPDPNFFTKAQIAYERGRQELAGSATPTLDLE